MSQHHAMHGALQDFMKALSFLVGSRNLYFGPKEWNREEGKEQSLLCSGKIEVSLDSPRCHIYLGDFAKTMRKGESRTRGAGTDTSIPMRSI